MTLANRTLVGIWILAGCSLSLLVAANVSVSDTSSTSFNFGGTISPICKIKGVTDQSAGVLVLDQHNTSQAIGSIELWCNTGRNATTRYSSANNGFLVDGANKIPYTLGVGNVEDNIDLTTEYVDVNTETGRDNKGTAKSQALKITPQSNGLDNAGQYSDTITVTVSYN